MTTDAPSNDSNLNSLIQSKRERYVDVLRELLPKSAESEEALQDEIAGHFTRLGCQVETISSTPNRFALASDFAPRLVPRNRTVE